MLLLTQVALGYSSLIGFCVSPDMQKSYLVFQTLDIGASDAMLENEFCTGYTLGNPLYKCDKAYENNP